MLNKFVFLRRKEMLKKLTLIALVLSMGLAFGAGKVMATPTLAPGGIGDLNMFGLYDVRDVDGRTSFWQNFIVIENTSNQWTAVHLRFRSWKKSIEVYDHVILLSPYDVFWAAIQLATQPGQTTDGQSYTAGEVLIWSTDYHTLYNSGLTYATQPNFVRWLTKFQADLLDDCGFVTDLTNLSDYEKMEMQAGHVEIIGLWQLQKPSPLYDGKDDTHVLSDVVADVYPDGAINIYDVMESLYYLMDYDANTGWSKADGWQTGLTANVIINGDERGLDEQTRLGLDCGNVIASAMSMGDTINARYQLANFVAVADFRMDTTVGGGQAWHRDQYDGGAIVYPVDTLFWSWNSNLDNGRTAFYVNPDWATTIGATVRDGDNIIGIDQVTGGCGPWAVDDFNNTWSLDDLEEAMANNTIWYQYYNGSFGANYTTDVVITFFTKNYHYFFADWPWWGGPGNIPSGYAAAFGTQANYWRAVYDYRGDRGATKIGGTTTANRSVEALTCNIIDTIAEHFESDYYNGRVAGYPVVFDMEQNKPEYTPDITPPPGSPWKPVPPPSGRYIPHEVNIIRVGAPTPTATGYITDADGFLTNAPPNNYDMGHFNLYGISLVNGQRRGGHYGDSAGYYLPSIGVCIFDLNYGQIGTDAVFRSTMSPWHFKMVE